MIVLGGKLQTGLEVSALVNAFMSVISAEGVEVADLRRAIDDKACRKNVVAALKGPAVTYEQRIAELGMLADTLNKERLDELLQDVFSDMPPYVIRMYGERPVFEKLLGGIRRGGRWQRAAIVLRYGLGRDGNRRTPEEIAVMVERSPASVKKFLSLTADSYDTAMAKLAYVHSVRPRQGFAPLDLSSDLLQVLDYSGVRGLAELRYFTEAELRRVFNEGFRDDPELLAPLMAELDRHEVSLYNA